MPLLSIETSIETIDVDGRTVHVIGRDGQQFGLIAGDGIVYHLFLFAWMDSPSTPFADGIEMRDVVIDAARNLPAESNAGR